MNNELHSECHHAYLIRRIDRLYYLIDVLGKKWYLPELEAKVLELSKIESI